MEAEEKEKAAAEKWKLELLTEKMRANPEGWTATAEPEGARKRAPKTYAGRLRPVSSAFFSRLSTNLGC